MVSNRIFRAILIAGAAVIGITCGVKWNTQYRPATPSDVQSFWNSHKCPEVKFPHIKDDFKGRYEIFDASSDCSMSRNALVLHSYDGMPIGQARAKMLKHYEYHVKHISEYNAELTTKIRNYISDPYRVIECVNKIQQHEPYKFTDSCPLQDLMTKEPEVVNVFNYELNELNSWVGDHDKVFDVVMHQPKVTGVLVYRGEHYEESLHEAVDDFIEYYKGFVNNWNQKNPKQ